MSTGTVHVRHIQTHEIYGRPRARGGALKRCASVFWTGAGVNQLPVRLPKRRGFGRGEPERWGGGGGGGARERNSHELPPKKNWEGLRVMCTAMRDQCHTEILQ